MVDHKLVKPPVTLLLASLVVLDVLFLCLSLFLLCVDVEIDKNGCLMLD